MKLTKTLMAAVALAAFAMPMTASAQIGPNDVIGHMNSVNGPVYIKRAGQILRVQNDSAVLAGDMIVAENGGSGMVNLNGCNGKFTPCNQFVSGGNMVSLASGNYCNDLAALLPIGPADAILTAAAGAGAAGAAGAGAAGAAGGLLGGGAIGTALSANALFGLLAAGALVVGVNEAVNNNDGDDPVEPDMPNSL